MVNWVFFGCIGIWVVYFLNLCFVGFYGGYFGGGMCLDVEWNSGIWGEFSGILEK